MLVIASCCSMVDHPVACDLKKNIIHIYAAIIGYLVDYSNIFITYNYNRCKFKNN